MGPTHANLTNPCWMPNARIWDLQRTLAANEYRHNPMAIPKAERGRHYFECYPHPAIVGLFDLNHILKYKVRHGDGDAWQQLVRLLQSLASAELPITNVGVLRGRGLRKTKTTKTSWMQSFAPTWPPIGGGTVRSGQQ